jgi:hypothetical protein
MTSAYLTVNVLSARELLVTTALRLLAAERRLDRVQDDGDATAEAEYDYALERLALAAQALTRATDALPLEEQPVGWNSEPDTA